MTDWVDGGISLVDYNHSVLDSRTLCYNSNHLAVDWKIVRFRVLSYRRHIVYSALNFKRGKYSLCTEFLFAQSFVYDGFSRSATTSMTSKISPTGVSKCPKCKLLYHEIPRRCRLLTKLCLCNLGVNVAHLRNIRLYRKYTLITRDFKSSAIGISSAADCQCPVFTSEQCEHIIEE